MSPTKRDLLDKIFYGCHMIQENTTALVTRQTIFGATREKILMNYNI